MTAFEAICKAGHYNIRDVRPERCKWSFCREAIAWLNPLTKKGQKYYGRAELGSCQHNSPMGPPTYEIPEQHGQK